MPATGQQDHQILKPRHSALRDTALDVLRRQRGIDALVIAGVAGDPCVLATAQQANMLGQRHWATSDTMAACPLAQAQHLGPAAALLETVRA